MLCEYGGINTLIKGLQHSYQEIIRLLSRDYKTPDQEIIRLLSRDDTSVDNGNDYDEEDYKLNTEELF